VRDLEQREQHRGIVEDVDLVDDTDDLAVILAKPLDRGGFVGPLAPEVRAEAGVANEVVERRGRRRLAHAVNVAPAHVERFALEQPERVLRNCRLAGPAVAEDTYILCSRGSARIENRREVVKVSVAVV